MIRLAFADKTSMAVVFIISIFGVLMIRSATIANPDMSGLWAKQLLWVGMGMVLYLMIAGFNYNRLINHAGLIYALGLAGLVLVLVVGAKVNGARSWFQLPFLSIQPSEFVKFATVLMVARFFSRFEDRQSSVLEFLLSSIWVLMPIGLILLQPDLGTALMYFPLLLVPNFLVGNRESIWVTLSGLALVAIITAGVVYKPNWIFFLKEYQKDRIVNFIFPERDTQNSGYQVHQSKISIGQGGLFGKGVGKGKQTKMGFLPYQHNDFILAVAAEETGFLGIAFLFGLFFLLIRNGIITAQEASNATGSILSMLVISTVSFQLFYNASMLIGLLPTTGIPCPLLSYGGSSYLASMSLLGLVQSVRCHRYVNQ